MKVSVIIPNYCHARFLTDASTRYSTRPTATSRSSFSTTAPQSTGRDIIETYRHHPRVSHIVYNEKNSGSTFIQWDKGFELAQGEYIWIAESDDEAAPTFLEECVGQLEKHPSATIAFSDCLFVDENTPGPVRAEAATLLPTERQEPRYALHPFQRPGVYQPPHVLSELHHERQHGGLPQRGPTTRLRLQALPLCGATGSSG